MVLDGLFRNGQLFGNLPVGASSGNQSRHLIFARRKGGHSYQASPVPPRHNQSRRKFTNSEHAPETSRNNSGARQVPNSAASTIVLVVTASRFSLSLSKG